MKNQRSHIKSRLLVFRLAICFLVLGFQICQGQFLVDSTLASLKKRPKFFFSFETSNSFVSGRGANTIGVKAGLSFGRRIKFGAGYYTLISDIVESRYIEKYDSNYYAKLQMNYYSTFIDFTLYEYNRWQFGFINQFGIGNSYFWYYPNKTENKNKTESINKRTIILYEPFLVGQYKIMKWFGVGFGTGYRIMLLTNKEVQHRLSSPVYTIRLKLYLDEIYNSVFPRGIFPKKTGKNQDQDAKN